MEEVVEAARTAHSTAGGRLPAERRRAGVAGPPDRARWRSEADIAGTIVRYKDGASGHDRAGRRSRARGNSQARHRHGGRQGLQSCCRCRSLPAPNTLNLTDAIDSKLDQVEKAMPPGVVLNRHVMRQSDFITLSVHNLIAVLRGRGDLRRHHPDPLPARFPYDADHADGAAAQLGGRLPRALGVRALDQTS